MPKHSYYADTRTTLAPVMGIMPMCIVEDVAGIPRPLVERNDDSGGAHYMTYRSKHAARAGLQRAKTEGGRDTAYLYER